MRKSLVPGLLVAALLAACDAATAPSNLADAGDPALSRASGALTDADPAGHDANGNGVVCVRTVPASGRASSSARDRIIVKDDDGSGGCPDGFETVALPAPATVTAGSLHACALDGTGAAWCWGDNSRGALGVTGSSGSLFPVQVQGAPSLVAITAGNGFTCGLDAEGTAWCWGDNRGGQLGNGDLSIESRATPAPVSGGLSFTSIDAGERYACGIDAGGRLHCWGVNLSGALGTTTTETCVLGGPCSSTPTPAAAGLLFNSVSAGLVNTCGMATDGLAYCWGWDVFHQGGDGLAITGPTPTPVAAPPDLVAVAAGAIGACGLDDAGAAYCWGEFPTNFGWLGTGSYTGSPTPAAVTGGHTFAAVFSSDANNIFWFQCGIDDADAAWCWGADFYGQIGTPDVLDTCGIFEGTPISCTATPHAVDGGHAWSELALGMGYACGRTTGGDIYCWGNNQAGMLGDGTTTSRSVPMPVAFGGSAAPTTSARAAPAAGSTVDARIIE